MKTLFTAAFITAYILGLIAMIFLGVYANSPEAEGGLLWSVRQAFFPAGLVFVCAGLMLMAAWVEGLLDGVPDRIIEGWIKLTTDG